jgi:hypothetical protein
MRKLVLGLVIAGTFGLGGTAVATAAPIAMAPIAGDNALMQPAHCRRWLPHRHAGAKPHGFGFGCSKPAKRSNRS